MSQFTVSLRQSATVRWQAEDEFFASVEGSEILGGKVDVTARVTVGDDGSTVDLICQGQVQVMCSRCLMPVAVPVTGEHSMEMPPEQEHAQLDWPIYETVALALPISPAHPQGECRGDVADALRQYMVYDDEENN